jgi:hypothetical protein
LCAPVIPSMTRSIKEKDWSPSQPGKKARLYLKNNQRKRAGDKTQMVECLPIKHKILNSNPNTTESGGT